MADPAGSSSSPRDWRTTNEAASYLEAGLESAEGGAPWGGTRSQWRTHLLSVVAGLPWAHSFPAGPPYAGVNGEGEQITYICPDGGDGWRFDFSYLQAYRLAGPP